MLNHSVNRRHFFFAPALLAAATVLLLTAGAAAMNFGSTGFQGEPQGQQIKVTKVAAGSPADGKVQPNDIIVGVNGQAFTGNPRLEMVPAIHKAEAGTPLILMLKGGKPVALHLPELGAYSDTAPWDCPKTEKLVTMFADRMVEQEVYAKGRIQVGFLGLMATGEQKYMDVVRRELPQQEWYTPDMQAIDDLLAGKHDMGKVGWHWGYQLITMAEYYLITKDETALPGIRTYALGLARGQDPAGLWGHRMISEVRNGRLPGYSHINQPSLSCYIGLLLAEKCGVDDPVVQEAIAKTKTFIASYVNRGALPYGAHGPKTKTFNNNGSSGSAAVAMKMLDHEAGAIFFSQQCAASYETMEVGHAAHYFNPFWTPLGVNVGGPELTQEFFKRANWVYTLYRTWDGSSGFEKRDLGEGTNLTMQLLVHCLPRRALHITGKQPIKDYWADSETVQQAIQASQIDYASLSVDELIALFDHPAPQVRIPAVWTLRERGTDFFPRLVELMNTGTHNQRMSALGFFGWQSPRENTLAVLEPIVAIVRDTEADPEVRAQAAACIVGLEQDAHPYINDILALIIQDKPDDPLGLIDGNIARSLGQLTKHPFHDGLVTDKKLLYQAALKLADNPRQNARAAGMDLLRGMPLADFPVVGEKVRHVAMDMDRGYHSYHNAQSVSAAIMVLADLQIKEGIPLTLRILEFPWGKHSFKLRQFMAALGSYGPHARPTLDQLRGTKLEESVTSGRFNRLWQQMVEQIETGEPKGELVTFDQAMNRSVD